MINDQMIWYFIGTREDRCVTVKGGFSNQDEVKQYLQHHEYLDVRMFAVTPEGKIMFTKKNKNDPIY